MPMSKEFEAELFPIFAKIIERFGSPEIIMSERQIRKNIRRLNTAFALNRLPFKEFYAVKAFTSPAILDIVYSEGCGFDCSSIPELQKSRKAGARPGDIMFTSNNTSQEEYAEALAHGGCILNLDDITFVDKVPDPFPELICFRLNPGNRKTGDEVNSIIGDPVKSKYGVPIESIVDAYRAAKSKGAKRFGLHTMVCSNDLDYTHMVSTVKLLLEVGEVLHRELGIKLEFINMGGGIGIPYRPEHKEFNIEALARECRVLADGFSDRLSYVPVFYMESGRFVTGPAGVLVTKIINRYTKYKDFYGVEVAMPGNARPGVYDKLEDVDGKRVYHHGTILAPDGTLRGGPTRIVTVAGSICENCDVLARDRELPEALEGDYYICHDDGAHGPEMGSNYNNRCRPQRLLICMDHTVRRIRRAETFEDLERFHQGLDGPKHTLKLR